MTRNAVLDESVLQAGILEMFLYKMRSNPHFMRCSGHKLDLQFPFLYVIMYIEKRNTHSSLFSIQYVYGRIGYFNKKGEYVMRRTENGKSIRVYVPADGYDEIKKRCEKLPEFQKTENCGMRC